MIRCLLAAEIRKFGRMRHSGNYALIALSFLLLTLKAAGAEGGPVRGADELFWVPTLEQALKMSAATGRPMFLMGYSLVDNKSTYTKFGPEFCSSVF